MYTTPMMQPVTSNERWRRLLVTIGFNDISRELSRLLLPTDQQKYLHNMSRYETVKTKLIFSVQK
jgi:hypothetical protein